MSWRALIIFIVGLLCSTLAYAEDAPVVTVEPGNGTADDAFNLEVTVSGKNSGQLGQPEFEPSDDFEIQSVGTSTRNESINGVQSYQISYAFQVTAKRDLPPGQYALPKGFISIDGKNVPLNPGRLTILASAPGAQAGSNKPAVKAPTGIDFTQIVDNEAPYVGEQITYRSEIATSLALSRANLGDVAFNGFWHEAYGKNQERRRAVGDTIIYSIYDALFPTRAGEIEIPARALSVDVRVPRPRANRKWDMFDDFFADLDAYGEFQVVTRRLTAPPIHLRVKELPPPPKPGLGNVPVGDVQVSAQFDQKLIKQGDSVSLTVQIYGDANLKPFSLPEPSEGDMKDFTIYPDQPQVDVSPTAGRVYFKKTFHLALIPQRSGKLKLPAYEIITFDPKSKEYKVQHTGGGTLDVLPSLAKENLVAKGLPVEQSASLGKEEIQVLGEDLHPIHIGPESYVTSEQTAPSVLVLLVLMPPLLTALAAAWIERNRRLGSDPARARQSRALQKAQAALRGLGSEASPEGYLQVLRTYLGDRLRIPGESLTSADSEERLSRAGLPRELSTRVTALLSALQRAVYGGPAAGTTDALERFRTELENTVTEVERHAKR